VKKKQKGQALISKEDAPHEGKREKGPTPSVMSERCLWTTFLWNYVHIV